MNKAIVLHDKYSNEPIVIRICAILAVRKEIDRTGDVEEEYTDIFIGSGSFLVGVKEPIGTVLMKIKKAESEEA